MHMLKTTCKPALAIISSGKASRLSPLLGDYPKCLMPIGGKSALLRTWELWRQHISELYVVTNWADKVRCFCKANGIRATVIEHNMPDGSANAIAQLPTQLEGHPIVLHWSDLVMTELPAEQMFSDEFDYCLTDKRGYRYNCPGHGIIEPCEEGKGNVAGMYFVKQFKLPANDLPWGTDFADIANEGNTNWKPMYLESHHFGSVKEASATNAKLPFAKGKQCTKLKVADGYVYKKAKHEVTWHQLLDNWKATLDVHTPFIRLDGENIVMRELDCVTLAQLAMSSSSWDKAKAIEGFHVLEKLSDVALPMPHVKTPLDAFVRTRLRLRGMFDMKQNPFGKYYLQLADHISNRLSGYPANMQLCHGDLIGDNLLWDGDAEQWHCIDPQESYLHGLPRGYNLGKVLYAFLTWSPYAIGTQTTLLELSRQLGDTSVYKRLLSNDLARLWAATHLLAAPVYFSHDAHRYFSILETNLTLATDLCKL